jgi:hypothetical protein
MDLASLTDHDDLLFQAQLNTGFTGLLRLSEITWPNKVILRDYKKVTMCFSLEWAPTQYSVLFLASDTQSRHYF